MPSLGPAGVGPSAADVEQWLEELGLTPLERVDREGMTSWDLKLDGLRRFDVRITLILDPALALIAWVHFAPPIGDSFRKSYRKLLHWNDDYPFAKFALGSDERLVLTSEVPLSGSPLPRSGRGGRRPRSRTAGSPSWPGPGPSSGSRSTRR